ncbi:hypothetical protein JNJ66_06935 [Candidatus Saccharibacteria bacterium]|nr:hypothetical protein [Candidatus Saccharibacteria bacterium]
MKHADYPVDLLDETGKKVGQKPRIDIIKPKDIYHTAHVILISPRGELVLSTIPVREDLPNLYANKIGTTMATIKRSTETGREAALRGVSRELFIDDMPLVELGSQMHTLPDGSKNFISAFYGIADPPGSYSVIDIESLLLMTPSQLDALMQEEDRLENLAASLITVWETYRDKFPV